MLSAVERPFLAAQTSSSGSQSKAPSSRPSRGPWRLQHPNPNPNTSHSEHNDALNRPPRGISIRHGAGAARGHGRADHHRGPRARFRAGLHAPLNLDTSQH
ncbi:hypothetical protein CesoFtcFv8_022688 [Champsocephalus esox]|uniref:Uncharacterized protein n=1 Tax=Champsocephalus esox TaxID=159716 RepID=A0AAN8B796_9TELE|nr:hypothetical protein CesoFtcFv8_022688 [Champsocephalus esox]